MFDEYGETVRIERTVSKNSRGDREVTSVPLDGALFDTSASSENRDNRDLAISTGKVFVPFGSDVRSGDVLVRGNGQRWHVDGDPYQHEHGWDLGMEVPARRTRG